MRKLPRPLPTSGRPSIELQLDRSVQALDELVGAVRGGIRSQQHFNELEERAAAIAKGVRDAFRSQARAA